MLLNAYSLYDQKALTYSPPFYCSAHGQAVRMVMDLANDSNTMVGRHPADFTLYCIGQFDDSVGGLLPAGVREHIADALTLVTAASRDFFGRPEAANYSEPERHPLNPTK
ncbi:nonstructural protein [Blackfly microvirus SF02]|uniref:Nonstructural protein n=1 Tax=Blackfly microvirus SF02 TaxID=2576452 RepID=A0A4P8PJZ0_9VIRU|nr:nonstructural protein [Blackfly microvirus SF02]